jgi:trehalose/maltose hydrolase-like predicted phosphorylase
MQHAFEPTADPAWILREQGYDPSREASVESRFSIGNGFLGVRGARAISRGPMWVSWLHTFTWASWPRTYVAGLFDTPNIEPPVPALVPAPDWLRARILLDGEPLVLRSGNMLAHCRTLDLRRGVLLMDWRQRSRAGVIVRVRSLRLVSLADRALGLQLVRIEVGRDGVEVTLEASFEGVGLGLDPVLLENDLGVWHTEGSRKGLAVACACELSVETRALAPTSVGHLKWTWSWRAVSGEVAAFARLIAVARADRPGDEHGRSARDGLARARHLGWRGVLAAHEAAWAERWRLSDIAIEGDAPSQEAVRFAIYHLISAANPADEHVSIGARALTGDRYLGHVFWDTEIYLLPFYITTWPEAARSLLMYRFHTLPAARAKAREAGWRGAMYPWESADTGEEATPEQIIGPDGRPVRVLCGAEEQHVTADIAYAVWRYWQASGDATFLRAAGAEILVETAKFWASRAQADADGGYHIRGVIGPDEYHEHVDDNAYTNVMARWNLRAALAIAALLRARWPESWSMLAARLDITDAELARWEMVAEGLTTGLDPRTGLLEQFAGFFDLEAIDVAAHAHRATTLDLILGRARTQRAKVVKQADVVALIALREEEFDVPTRRANFRFYEPLCSHDSSLSRPMHAIVAARLGETDLALRYFRETAAVDVAGTAADSAGGVHIAALGGLWQTVLVGFAGLALGEDAVALDPHLPVQWRALSFRVRWHDCLIAFRIVTAEHRLEATLEAGRRATLVVKGERRELGPGPAVTLHW